MRNRYVPEKNRTEEREVPPAEKKGLLRVFELIDRDGGKFFKAGILAFLGLLPFIACMMAAVTFRSPLLIVLCIPAGMIAAPQIVCVADTVLRSMRNETGWWFAQTYKKVWKRSLRPSLLPGAVTGLIAGIQIWSVYYIAGSAEPKGDLILLCSATILALAVTGYYLPMMCCMELPIPALLRNSVTLFLFHPLKSLFSALIRFAYAALILIWFPLTGILLAVFSLWLPMCCTYPLLYPVLDEQFGLQKAYDELKKEKWGAARITAQADSHSKE